MSVVSRIMKNAISLLAGQGYSSLVGLGAIALISRYLSIELFGDYGFVLAVCFTFMVITDMGCNQIAIREMARDLDNAESFFSVLLALRLLLAFVTAGCIVIAINIMTQSEELIHVAYIGILAVVVYIVGDVFDDVFKAHERMEFSAVLNFVQPTFFILGVLAVVNWDLGLKGIFLALLISYAARFVTGLLLMRKLFFRASLSWDRKRLFWLFREAFPLGIRRILRKISFRVDTILLKLMRTSADAGIFHGAQRIVIVLQFLPRNITDALFPLFSRYFAKETNDEKTVVIRSFKVFLVFALPLSGGLFLLSDQVVTIVLGKKFLEAAKVLRLISFGWFAMFFSVFFNKVLVAANRQTLSTVAVGLTAATNVILGVILIPHYGYVGAGVAMLSGETVGMVASSYYVHKNVCQLSSVMIAKPMISMLAAAAATYSLWDMPMVVKLFAAIVVYSVMLVVLQTLDRQEVDVLMMPLRKGRAVLQRMALRIH